jgi:hypothetical protein
VSQKWNPTIASAYCGLYACLRFTISRDTLLAFFSRIYWQRLWIITELVLNHNMSLFLCGERQVSRGMLLPTFGFYQKNSGRIDTIISKKLEVVEGLIAPVYRSIWTIFYQVYYLITTGGQTKEMSTLKVVLGLGRKQKQQIQEIRFMASLVFSLTRWHWGYSKTTRFLERKRFPNSPERCRRNPADPRQCCPGAPLRETPPCHRGYQIGRRISLEIIYNG